MAQYDQAKNKEDYALLIGIEKYPFLTTLQGVQQDVSIFQGWLMDPNGGSIPDENIFPILSPPDINIEEPWPTRDAINGKLRIMGVRQGKRIGRRLYFYFSGHGYGTIDDVAMLMGNASEDELSNNIGLRNYRNFFKEWGFFDEIIFILDCCRDSNRLDEPAKPGFNLQGKAPPIPAPPLKYVSILACQYGAKAFMIPDAPGMREKRGVLTKAFFEGLIEQRATDSIGDITTLSLTEYLKRRVPEIMAEYLQKRLQQIHDQATRERIEEEEKTLRDQRPEFDPPLPEQNIIIISGIQKTQRIGIFLPTNIDNLTITNNKSVDIVEYTLNNGNWKFRYLSNDPADQKYVQRVEEVPEPMNPASGSIIRVDLIQNAYYSLTPSNLPYEILDLRKIDSNNINYVFRFT